MTHEEGKSVKKKIAIAAATLIVLLAGLWTFVELRYGSGKNAVYDVTVTDITIPTDEADVEAGCRVVTVHTACTLCHGDDFGGGSPMEPSFAVGALYGPNLTRGGVTKDYAPADWVRALRHGVKKDGKPLFFMPSHEFTHLSDTEVGQVAACLQSLPAVEREMPPSSPGPVMRAMYAFGAAPIFAAELIDHTSARPQSAPPATDKLAWGEHLTMSCRGCHGHNFSGGKIPGTPPDFPLAANLTPHESAFGSWGQADFVRAMREGKSKDGHTLDPIMPVQLTKKLSDEELDAMWSFLKTVPPAAFAEREHPSS
jgi:cytochrome c553